MDRLRHRQARWWTVQPVTQRYTPVRYIMGWTDYVVLYGTPQDEDSTPHHTVDGAAVRRVITKAEALARCAPRHPAVSCVEKGLYLP